MTVSILFPAVLLFLLLALLAWTVSSLQSKKSLEKDIKYYRTTYCRRQGCTLWNDGMLTYDLRSLDGGRTWYSVKVEGGSVKIVGEANTVYPGLLKTLDGWEALIAHVEKNGPIGSGSITSEDLQMLTNVGFKIEQK